MKRKFPFLAALIAELARFLALMLLSANLGVIGDEGGMARLLRYSAAPQLLFAAGFFFLWLDSGRYIQYRPLLAAGKFVSLIALAPLAAQVAYSMAEPSVNLRDPRSALAATLFIAAADLFSLSVLALCRATPAPRVAVPAAAAAEEAEPVPLEMPAASLERGSGGAEKAEV